MCYNARPLRDNRKERRRMRTQKKKNGELGARHGGHDPDKVMVGGFVKPEQKALIRLTAQECDCESLRLMLDGVNIIVRQMSDGSTQTVKVIK